MKKINFLLVFLLLSFVGSVYATDYYVTATGVATNDGLSWSNPKTLDAALATAVSDDVIHIGAGRYVPATLLTNGSGDMDATFEIKNNVSLIGGYPAAPTSGDTPSDVNKTIFDGLITEGYNAYHVVAVTAPVESGKKVTLSNIGITGGKAAASGAAVTVNSIPYLRVNGSAIIVAASELELNNCHIYNNEAALHTPGIYAFANSIIHFNSCLFENNIGAGNGASLWAASSTVYSNNSSFIGNKCSGVGAIQLITKTKGYFYNSTISGNVAGYNNSTNSRNGSGFYVRDGSELVLVNSTVHGNTSNGNGAGIAMHTSNATTLPIKVTIISSTITANKSTILTTATPGVSSLTAGCTVNIYNSIISGNIIPTGGTAEPDLAVFAGSTATKSYSVITDKVYDATGTEVTGKTFDPATMLDVIADNGGTTKTSKLLLTDAENPARTLGMTVADLTTLGASLTPAVPAEVISKNQMGQPRTNMIGAWTVADTLSGVHNIFKPEVNVYSDGTSLFVKTDANNLITIYSVTGQKVKQILAKEDITKIDNLVKNTVYIVKVSGSSAKVIL